MPLLNNYDPEKKGRIEVGGNYERKNTMNNTRIHRYEKIKNAIIAILKFNSESKSLYRQHSLNVYRACLRRALEECPGYIDSYIEEYCEAILEQPKENVQTMKSLAKKALDELSWEEKSGRDLYPCIEV